MAPLRGWALLFMGIALLSGPALGQAQQAQGGSTAWVQLGAYSTPELARESSERVRREHADLLASVTSRTVQHPNRPLVRLQVGPLDRSGADALCRSLMNRGQSCWVAVEAAEEPEVESRAASPMVARDEFWQGQSYLTRTDMEGALNELYDRSLSRLVRAERERSWGHAALELWGTLQQANGLVGDSRGTDESVFRPRMSKDGVARLVAQTARAPLEFRAPSHPCLTDYGACGVDANTGYTCATTLLECLGDSVRQLR